MRSFRKLALRLFSVVLPMLLVVSLVPAVAFAESGKARGDATYVAFTSDVHNASSSKTGGSAARLNNWINNVSSAVGSSFENMAFCGDTGTANVSTNNFWTYVQVVMDVVSTNGNVAGDGVFINGNHEFKEGAQSSSNTNAAAQKVKNIGYVAEGNDYLIYVFGARSSSQGFNSSDITALGNWLDSTPAGKPIFVVSHFPLHKNGSRDSENKASVISTLNAYSDKHEIYFLWGHNHTDSDSKYDEVITGTLENKAIGFTYLSAGCMSDSEYSSGSAYVKGKGLVAKIEGGEVTSLTYYGEKANVVYSYIPDHSNKPGVDPDCSHSGGNATCKDKAVCAKCGEQYGSLNASNHSGGTEVRGVVAATCSKAGYTGDTYCLGCGAKTASGKTVAATGNHEGGTATCTNKARCFACGVEYGSLNTSNHVGGSEVRDAVVATCSKAGYTGDTWCLGCGAKTASGKTVAATGNHTGGAATCKDKAKCSACGVEYGNLNATNHAGGTEVRDVVEATCGSAGYTGDTWCLGCGAKTASGKTVAATGDHGYEDGFCTVCGAEDPDNGAIWRLTIEAAKGTYNGFAQQPVLTIKDGAKVLVEGKDYVISSKAQAEAGTYDFIVQGIGDYRSETTGEWTIAPAEIASVDGLVIADRFVTTGSSIKPTLTLSYSGAFLVKNVDYTVAYMDNVNPGTATVIVTGLGNFVGTTEVFFEILPKNEWMKDSNGWKYVNSEGDYIVNAWQEIGGACYHFDAAGYMQIGWLKDGGSWYYLKSSGKMAVNEWEKVGGAWYYFQSSGAMATGWLKDSGSWYYLKSSGAMASSEWEKIGGSWYYFNGSGVMQASKWIGDYYVLASGKMATSQWVGSYYVGADGRWIPNYR